MKFDFTQQPGLVRTEFYSPEPELALVTIITPFYNAGKYFEQTFNSVMNQTFPWFEWIIVDDGTNEQEHLDILETFAKQDKRISVIHQKNGGLSCARNTGFANAKTDIVIPLDADDVISPQYVEYLYFGMYYNPEAAWCYTCSVGFQEQQYLWKYPWDVEKLKTYNFLNYSAAIRKKDAEDIGGYKVEKWSYFEDWRFWLEMLGASKKPVHLGGYHFWYRRLDNGMLSNIRKDPERVEFCDNIIKNAAQKVDTSVVAKEYPVYISDNPYYTPRMFPWDERRKKNQSQRTHVLMIIPWMILGGADKFNLDLIAGLDRDKFEISIISTVSSENGWQQKFEKYTNNIFNLPEFLEPIYYLDYVSYYIQSRDIDMIMVTNSYRGYYMVPWLKKCFQNIPIIDYVHMEEWYWKAGGYARISGVVGNLLDKTYVCNSATRDVMINIFGRKPESVQTLYIGVDEEEYSAEKTQPGYLYKLLGISSKRPVILFPCRISPQKRPFMLLDIAEKVNDKYPDAAFVVVGDGEQLEELKGKICSRKLNDVIYCIGRSDQMPSCYRDAKITLICSLKEGLALTAYESCAMGVPVISSDVGGQKDLIDDTVGALIPIMQEEGEDYDNRKFAEEEVVKFADAVLELLNDKQRYEACSKNCRKKVEETFSTKKMIETFEKETEELLAQREKSKERGQCIESLGMLAEEIYILSVQEERGESQEMQAWHELNNIKRMRTWKLVQKYRHFMTNTSVGRATRSVMKWAYHCVKR